MVRVPAGTSRGNQRRSGFRFVEGIGSLGRGALGGRALPQHYAGRLAQLLLGYRRLASPSRVATHTPPLPSNAISSETCGHS